MKLTTIETAQLLKKQDKIVILAHASPDGDTLGSAYALCRALQQIGKLSKVLCGDKVSPRYNYLKEIIKPMDFQEEFIVSVDVADEKLLGELEEIYSGKIDLAIDHHLSNTMFAKNTLLLNAAANAEIIYDVIGHLEAAIDNEMAAAIYTGIATDTGCFKFSNTTSQSHFITGKLMEFDYDFGALNYLLFEMKTKERLKLETQIMEKVEFYFDGKLAMIILNNSMLNMLDNEDVNGISALPRQIEGVELGVTFKEYSENVWKVSFRSNSTINAQEICKAFGGGGHRRAAGCKMRGTLSECKSRILCEIEKIVC